MKTMIYEDIVFDDFVDEVKEYGAYYVSMCPCCCEKYEHILGDKVDECSTAWGTCSVKGCSNEADYYIDFDANEVEFDFEFEDEDE